MLICQLAAKPIAVQSNNRKVQRLEGEYTNDNLSTSAQSLLKYIYIKVYTKNN